jgi:hypothetical protein
MESTCQGGLSRFADTFHVLDSLVTDHGPNILSDLSKCLIPYEYSNDGSYYYQHKPVVLRGSSPVLARVSANAKNTFEMNTVQRVYWSPPFIAPDLRVLGTTAGGPLAAKRFADALESQGQEITLPPSPGTCAIFDNLRIVHARTAFDTSGGHRWLKGAYVDHQDFWSKVATYREDISGNMTDAEALNFRQSQSLS